MESGSRTGKRASLRASASPGLNGGICAMGRGARRPAWSRRRLGIGSRSAGARQRLKSGRGLLAPGAPRACPHTHSPPRDPGLSPRKALRRYRPSAEHGEPSAGSPTPSPTSRASSPLGASRGDGRPAPSPGWAGGTGTEPLRPEGRRRRRGVRGRQLLGPPEGGPLSAGRAGTLTACAGGSAAAAAAARPGARGAGPRTWPGGGRARQWRRLAGSGAPRCLSARRPSHPAVGPLCGGGGPADGAGVPGGGGRGALREPLP